jgi:hypothetical protein
VKSVLSDPPRVGVVNDFDFAAAPRQRMDEIAYVIAVATEVARRIEGRDDRDPERILALGAVIIHQTAPAGASSKSGVSGEFLRAGKSAS